MRVDKGDVDLLLVRKTAKIVNSAVNECCMFLCLYIFITWQSLMWWKLWDVDWMMSWWQPSRSGALSWNKSLFSLVFRYINASFRPFFFWSLTWLHLHELLLLLLSLVKRHSVTSEQVSFLIVFCLSFNSCQKYKWLLLNPRFADV